MAKTAKPTTAKPEPVEAVNTSEAVDTVDTSTPTVVLVLDGHEFVPTTDAELIAAAPVAVAISPDHCPDRQALDRVGRALTWYAATRQWPPR